MKLINLIVLIGVILAMVMLGATLDYFFPIEKTESQIELKNTISLQADSIAKLNKVTPFYDTITHHKVVTIGIPISSQVSPQLPRKGVWWAWALEGSGDVILGDQIVVIDGELFINCYDCSCNRQGIPSESGKYRALWPFDEYYDNEVIRQEAMLEIIRTIQFKYWGPEMNPEYRIIKPGINR